MKHSFIKNIFLAVAGIALAFGVFAVVMQITDTNTYDILVTDPTTGLKTYKPNSNYPVSGSCFENTAQINNLGFHGPDVSTHKKEGVFRIVIVGSSYAEARQMPIEDMYSSVLQEKLNALPNKKYQYEVVPLGVNGNGTWLDTLYYMYYGRPLSPDLVIDIESEFEVLDKTDAAAVDASGTVSLEVPPQPRGAAQQAVRFALRHFNVLVDLYSRYLSFAGGLRSLVSPAAWLPGASIAPAPLAQDPAAKINWSLKEKLLDALAQQVQKDTPRFLFASWMSPSATQEVAELYPIRAGEIAHSGNFSYIDLTPSVAAQEAQNGQATRLPCDVHWSQAGNGYIAQALFQYLSANPTLIERK